MLHCCRASELQNSFFIVRKLLSLTLDFTQQSPPMLTHMLSPTDCMRNLGFGGMDSMGQAINSFCAGQQTSLANLKINSISLPSILGQERVWQPSSRESA